jgi:hypothetical protein
MRRALTPSARARRDRGQTDAVNLDLRAWLTDTRRVRQLCCSNSDPNFIAVLFRFGCFAWRSGLRNPYGAWSPRRAPSEAPSSEPEFGTAREYDTADLFFGEKWLYDDHVFQRHGDEEDKFIIGPDAGSRQSDTCDTGDDGSRRHAHSKHSAGSGGCAEVYTSPPCRCCHGEREKDDQESVSDSWSAVYGRYQIMDDLTEVLDECGSGAGALKFRRNVDDGATLKGGPLVDSRSGDAQEFDLSALEKELQMLSPYLAEEADALNSKYFWHRSYSSGPFVVFC